MDFISGTYFKHKCKYRIGQYIDARKHQYSFEIDDNLDNENVFCKTEYLAKLMDDKSLLPDRFNLFTHNSDINIYYNIADTVLDNFPQMKHWYAQNLAVPCALISPIPIGIANPKWSHGNIYRFLKVIKENNSKDNLVYANFNINTNREERQRCLNSIDMSVIDYPDWNNIEQHNRFVQYTQEQYLRDMSKSYFTISPKGNGLDCHRTWEALYMKSIPIVTKSVCSEYFSKLGIPLLILDDWGDFDRRRLSSELYTDIWGDFDIEGLNIDLFVNI